MTRIYSSQKAKHFPPRYRYIDPATGERGEEPLPPGSTPDEFAYQAALTPQPTSPPVSPTVEPVVPAPSKAKPSAPAS